MRSISEVAAEDLLWLQPAARKRDHELRAGDDVVATLHFQRGSLADAEAAGAHWTFKRQGFWHPRVTVRTAGSDADLAVFHPRWVGGGALEFPDGRTVRLSSANFWQSEWLWQENEKPLIRFKGRHGLIKARGAVEVSPEGAALPDLPMLILLGWYLILLHAEDSAAASSASTVAVISTT
ncbi:MAG TPA: hypothetical protein VF990_06735 [Candidatus Dormibacteraeota bacterium]